MEHRRFDALTRTIARRADRRGVLTASFLSVVALTGLRVPGASAAVRGNCRTVPEDQIRSLIRKAANKYGVNYETLLCVAMCESGLNNCAVNRAGKSYGLFQFKKATWQDRYLNPEYNDKDYWDPKWSALATAEMWSRGLSTHWDCCCPHWGCRCPGPNPSWC
ncbi:MAG: transglycosylase SLT domain-containing protein [Chloroflexota bacterium]